MFVIKSIGSRFKTKNMTVTAYIGQNLYLN